MKVLKSFFCQEKVELLGHVVIKEVVLLDPKKVEELSKTPRPTMTTELRSFLGLFSYYRRFIKVFAATSSALHASTLTVRDF